MTKPNHNGANLGFKRELWQAAEAAKLDALIAANPQGLGFEA